jgi:hypothetical protein
MVISLRLPDDLAADLKALAELESRSVNSLIVMRLGEAVYGRKQSSTVIIQEPIVERAVSAGVERGHDTKTCRIYGCLMCKALKA